MTEPESPIKSHCNRCLAETNHDVLHRCKRESHEEDDEGNLVFRETFTYELVSCRGCENVSLRRTYSSSAQPDVDVDYFPPAVSRKQPQWLSGLCFFWDHPQSDIEALFREVYSALYAGSNRLALMGSRAIVDLALTDKLGDIGGFEQKLAKAKELGWITPAHCKFLKVAVDAGNAASHRAYRPETQQLALVLDIVEHLIQLLYVLEQNADEIAKKTPARPKK